jgi:threonine aldolase
MNDKCAIDLRSDTITQPTPAMRAAMADAEVGDDTFGDDPTMQRLEACVAEMLGKESALFTPSGTMANQLALRAHTESGDEILVDANAHIYYSEAGGPAALSGVSCRCLAGVHGIFTAKDVETALRPPDQHFPPTKLVCLENTHNRGGGTIWPMERIREVADIARRQGLRMHLDGARLWNASVATGIAERDYAAHFDSVSVCFSKGLVRPSVRRFAGRATSFSGRGDSVRCSAAGCGRRGFWPRGLCTRWSIIVPVWPKTIGTLAHLPKGWPVCPASNLIPPR